MAMLINDEKFKKNHKVDGQIEGDTTTWRYDVASLGAGRASQLYIAVN